jgi:hypothetical protein
MATQRIPALQFPSQTSPQHIPSSFQEALRLGWTIVKEESAIEIKSRKRKGVVLLRLKDAPMRLRVPYIATAKEWQFGTPEAIE